MTSRTTIAVAASAGACVLTLGLTGPAATAAPEQAQDTGLVSVFHGIPGMTVDVYANGDELLSDFKPGTVTDPRSLDAGTYDIEVFKAGQDPDGTPALEKEVKVAQGGNATVAAHLSTDGKPRLTTFTNDVSKTEAGKARLTVRHVAAAPAVDVRAGGQPLFTDLTNPDEDTTSVDSGTVNADVVLAGTDTVAIGPAELTFKEGTANVVYAWGSTEDKTLSLADQTFSGLESTPHAVHAGGRGAAITPNPSDQWALWAATPERSR
ncbi:MULTISPECIES: DUF4397 domain-containing protein [unclassified Streptomyces]|uniref:DUF4397 domain-containing protein n=1 Tax=unclassified Streptomyces TaxID=2593676 RepID=UPI000C9AAFA3|nr:MULTISPECIES: DUF4397 domain-containing protein [unclassified Streptomyces]QUW95350.1 hypothetical protein KE639_06619 [Streptomyces sp. V17-9]